MASNRQRALEAALRWYVDNDSTQEGGHWEVHCATELRHKREAARLLATSEQDDDVTAELISALSRAESEVQRMWTLLRTAWAEASTAKLAHNRALIARVNAQVLLREALQLLPDGDLRARVEANLEPNNPQGDDDT